MLALAACMPAELGWKGGWEMFARAPGSEASCMGSDGCIVEAPVVDDVTGPGVDLDMAAKLPTEAGAAEEAIGRHTGA